MKQRYMLTFILLGLILINNKIIAQNSLIAPTIIEYNSSYTNANLVWKDQNYHGIKYKIYSSNDGSTEWIQIGTVDYKWTPYYSDNIGWGMKKFYKVSAYDPISGATSNFSDIVSVATPSEPTGTIYYVDATNGNDNNSGTGEGKAWKTLNKVEASDGSFSSGTRILLKRGEIWNESLIINAGGGSSGNTVIFDAYGIGAKPIINAGNSVGINCERSFYTFRNIHVKNYGRNGLAVLGGNMNEVTFEHCRVENISPSTAFIRGIYIIASEPNGKMKAAWNEISGYSNGIQAARGQNHRIEFNYVYNTYTGEDGLVAGGENRDMSGTIIRYNHVTKWGEDAIDFYYGINLLVEHNYFHDPLLTVVGGQPQGNGAKMGGSGKAYGCLFRNNIIHSLHQPDGLNQGLLQQDTDMDAYGNLIWDTDGPGIIIRSSNCDTYNNTVLVNQASTSSPKGIMITGAPSNVKIQNNIISGKVSSVDLDLYGASVTGGYNVLINDASASNGSKYTGSSNDFYRNDPLFVNMNSKDFRLKEGSPCIEAGIIFSQFIYDIFGSLIPSGSKPAIGALQYVTMLDPGSTPGVKIDIQVILEGAYAGSSLMYTLLNSSGVIPLNHPFPYIVWGHGGNESISNLPANVVDWILVELRSGVSPSSKISSRAALLKNDGHIVDLDGNSPLNFEDINSNNYYIVIKHRNHLSIMTANSVSLSSNSINSYNFTNGQSKSFGSESQINLGDTVFGMYAGDGEGDGIINNMDYSEVGNCMFEIGYKNCDHDMNGIVNVLDYGKSSLNQNKVSQIQ